MVVAMARVLLKQRGCQWISGGEVVVVMVYLQNRQDGF
jgi:hypothetical protein